MLEIMLCLVSAVLSAAICLQAAELGRSLHLIDHPDGALKTHVSGTPLVGGLALLIPSLLVTAIYILLTPSASYMHAIVGACTATIVLGVLDDRLQLSARARFIVLFLIVLGAFAVDPLLVLNALRFGVSDIDVSLPLGYFAIPFTAITVVGFVNAVNMTDGMNGQFLGSFVIWSFFLGRYLGFDPDLPIGIPFAVLISSGIVVLAFNLRGRLFSGSAGAYAGALFIGLSTIAAYRRGGALSAVEPVLWFWLPVLDCTRLMVLRAISGKSPFSGDRNHIHHALQDIVGARFALVVYLAFLAAPGAAAMLASGRLMGVLALLFCIGLYGAILYFRPQLSTGKAEHSWRSRSSSFYSQ